MVTLKLMTVGSGTGAVIPEEMLTRLKVSSGDTLFAIETPSGYLLTSHDPEVEKDFRHGCEFMDEYQETFRALAK